MNSYLKYMVLSVTGMLGSSLSAKQMPPSFRESASLFYIDDIRTSTFRL